MNVLLISKDRGLYTTKRFLEASGKMNMDLNYVNPLEISINLNDKKKYQLFVKNQAIEMPDAVINRFGARGYPFGFLIGYYCKINGIPIINPFDSVIYGKNKFVSLNIARELQIEIPPTFFPAYASDLASAVENKVKPPFIIKIQTGTQGIGVMLARDTETMQAIADYLWDKNEIFMIQHFFNACEKKFDVRLLFFDQEYLGAYSRESKTEEFRSNFHRGGNVFRYDPGLDLISRSRLLMKKTGLRFAGIDYIIKRDGNPVFLEINESPGFEAFEKIHGASVAEKVLNLLADSLK